MATKKIVEKKKPTPLMKQVSKKTAYDVKEASNPKLTVSARKNYADNAQAAMKDSPAKMKSPAYMKSAAYMKDMAKPAVKQLAKPKVTAKKAPAKMKNC